MKPLGRLAALCSLALAVMAAGCSGVPAVSPAPAQPQAAVAPATASTKIQHVVIVIQENRSFDNFFATFPGADGATEGTIHTGARVKLAEVNLVMKTDILHGYAPYVNDYDRGRMDGFDVTPAVTGKPAGLLAYQYVYPQQIAAYWTLARRYVLADHLFMTTGSDSFIAHQDLIAGGTQIDPASAVINAPSQAPWGCDAPAGTVTSLVRRNGMPLWQKGPFPCFSYPTLGALLNGKNIPWRYYVQYPTYSWSAFDAIKAIRYGARWRTNISTPQTTIFKDVTNGALPAVSWVIPAPDYSDHPGEPRDYGPDWVGNVVNAIGESPYWKSTAIVIVWDDWGGLYDHVAPPQYGFGELGFRVPAIIVSPYARRGYVAHEQFEFGSILRFIEDNWSLGRLGSSDVRANSIGSVFNFRQTPRRYVPVKVGHSRAFFISMPPSNRPLDSQ
ncbi:MAG TPA: alkaline phosphatase family protein [Candidatus Baltobacteraceae bacterium]|jgi:phospholipase C